MKKCPCHSGLRYGECCAPFHAGEREAETPVALMRSRYAAFAMGLGAYLARTLARGHEDYGKVGLAESLSRARDGQRFAGLRILQSKVDGERGELRFAARIYDGGKDVSFAELSQFVREDGAWRYLAGRVQGAAGEIGKAKR